MEWHQAAGHERASVRRVLPARPHGSPAANTKRRAKGCPRRKRGGIRLTFRARLPGRSISPVRSKSNIRFQWDIRELSSALEWTVHLTLRHSHRIRYLAVVSIALKLAHS